VDESDIRHPSTVSAGRRYRTIPPPPALRPFVECLWVHAVDDPAPGEDDGRILPDGRMDLVWVRGLGALVAGPQSQATARPQGAPFLAVGARFHPGAAPGLLRLPASELLDEHVPLAAADAALARRIEAAVERAGDDRTALAALSRELLRCLDAAAEPDPEVRAAVRLLARPRASVADVARRVHLSERQLERRFTEAVGYGPKTLERVLRFQRAVTALGSPGTDGDLAGAAAAAGYADQSHLSRETRRLAGLSPGQLVRWLG
jgi:AraC-like DNA-binding protein